MCCCVRNIAQRAISRRCNCTNLSITSFITQLTHRTTRPVHSRCVDFLRALKSARCASAKRSISHKMWCAGRRCYSSYDHIAAQPALLCNPYSFTLTNRSYSACKARFSLSNCARIWSSSSFCIWSIWLTICCGL